MTPIKCRSSGCCCATCGLFVNVLSCSTGRWATSRSKHTNRRIEYVNDPAYGMRPVPRRRQNVKIFFFEAIREFQQSFTRRVFAFVARRSLLIDRLCPFSDALQRCWYLPWLPAGINHGSVPHDLRCWFTAAGTNQKVEPNSMAMVFDGEMSPELTFETLVHVRQSVIANRY